MFDRAIKGVQACSGTGQDDGHDRDFVILHSSAFTHVSQAYNTLLTFC